MKTTNFSPVYKQWNLPEGAKACIEIGKGDVSYWRCNDIQFSPNGTQLAVSIYSWTQSSTINEIRIYNVWTSEDPVVFTKLNEGHSSIAFSPDGKLLASGGDNNAVHLWNVFAGTSIHLTGHTQRVNDIAFSPDGHTVASGSQDGTIRLWDISNNSHKKCQLYGPVTSVAFSSDGKILACGAQFRREWMSGYTVYLWDTVTYRLLRSQKVHVGGGWISHATISPDVKTLATQVEGPVVFLWDIDTGGYKGGIEGDRYKFGCSPTCVVFSPDGKTLASGGGTYPFYISPPDQSSDNTVYLWDVVKSEIKTKLLGHTGNVDSIAFSSDGRTLASVGQGQDSTVLFWNVDTDLGSASIVSPVPTPNVIITDKSQDTVTEENAEFQQRSFQIQQICEEYGITTLVHFTRIENLRCILGEGLLSRSILEPREKVHFNDPQRLDKQKDAICLNISFPNYQMFYSIRERMKSEEVNDSQWVVLLLDARVLWELDCAFCQRNAATNAVRSIPLEERKKPEALKDMFTDFYVIKHQDLPIPKNYPTHPQAEVLVFDRIPTEYINAIHFWDATILEQWRSNYTGTFSDKFFVDRMYFKPRSDFEKWRPENFNTDGIPLSYFSAGNDEEPDDFEDDIPF